MPFVTEEHEEIRRSVRDFVEQEVKPIANDLDRQNKEIPEHILKKMAELGYFGVIFPEEQGGMGLDYISMAIVTEELSRGWLSVGSVMTRNLITGTLISANGTDEQKKRLLPKIARGELMTAAAFTEPDSGSDTASFKTARGQKWRRLSAQGIQDVVHLRQSRECPDRDGAHRSRRLQASQRTVAAAVREDARRRFRAAASDRLADSHHRLPRDEQLRAAIRRRLLRRPRT